MIKKRNIPVLQSCFIAVVSFFTAFLVRTCWLGKIEGLEHIPASPCIIIANHASYLDFLLLGYVLKRKSGKRFRFWAKTKVVKHGLWKTYSALYHSIEVNGNFRKLTELSVQAIQNGEYVCIFPEGQRSRNGAIQSFKSGYLHLAASSGIEVVPVFLENTYRAWPAHKVLPTIQKCHVRFYPALPVAKNIPETDLDELNRKIMEKYGYYEEQTRNHSQYEHVDTKTN